MNDEGICHMRDGRGGLGRLTGSDAGSRKALAEFYGRLFKEFHLTQPQSDCFVLAFDALKHEKLRKECVVNVNKTKAQANAQVLGSSPSFMEPPVSAGRIDDASARNHRALAQTGGSNEPVQPAGRAGVRKVSMGSDPSGSAQQSAMPAAARVPAAAEAVPMPGQSKVRKVRQTDSDAPAALSHAESALADGSDGGQQPVDSTTKPPSAQSPRSPAEQQPLRLPRAAAATTDPAPFRVAGSQVRRAPDGGTLGWCPPVGPSAIGGLSALQSTDAGKAYHCGIVMLLKLLGQPVPGVPTNTREAKAVLVFVEDLLRTMWRQPDWFVPSPVPPPS